MMKENLQTALVRMRELIQLQSIGDVGRAAQLQMPLMYTVEAQLAYRASFELA